MHMAYFFVASVLCGVSGLLISKKIYWLAGFLIGSAIEGFILGVLWFPPTI
jgi:hypothetical protein